MQCNEKERESLLRFMQNARYDAKLESGFRDEARGILSDAQAALSGALADVAKSNANSILRPKRNVDWMTTQDHRTAVISTAAAYLGCAVAALEVLMVVSGGRQSDLLHSANFSYRTQYNRFKELCYKNGYREEEWRKEE